MKFIRFTLAGLMVVGCVAATPTFASQLTDAFVANAKPNVDFLDKSSRLALQRSSSRRIKAYAQDVAARETIVANTIVAWWQSNTSAGASAALGSVSPGADFNPLAPLEQITGSVSNANDDGATTGRSVAVDGQYSPAVVATGAKPLLPAQQADFRTLKTLHGRRFDKFYELTQRNSLRQLVALYRDYASHGDDPALRSMSTLQLAKTNDLIRRLNTLR